MADVHQAKYPTVDFVLQAIAGWVNRYRETGGFHHDLGQCSPEDVMQIARDIGIPADELRSLAAKGPDAAQGLEKLLRALHVDPDALTNANPAVMRDLQRLCIACDQKKRCQHELAQGSAAGHFHEYCPNAYTLDALFRQTEPAPHA